jgi:hypothetical protein
MSELLIQARAVAAAMRFSRRQVLTVGLVIGLLLGLGGGLFFGWIVWPVGYAGEVSVSQVIYVEMVADLFAFDHNQERTRKAMDWPDAAATTCSMMAQTTDEGRKVRLWTLLMVMGEACE